MLDFALGIPLSDKLRGYELKHIPRKAMKGKLPDFIYNLPKRGFPTPLHRWFKKELKDYVKSFILDAISRIDMIRREAVERMISDYQRSIFELPHDEIRAHKIWILLNLVIYFKNQKNRYQRR
jgi:asparagine synthase (glutamine-hydrolysing)